MLEFPQKVKTRKKDDISEHQSVCRSQKGISWLWTYFLKIMLWNRWYWLSFMFCDQEEEKKFQQAGYRNSQWVFLFSSQQPLSQWGSQRGTSQEMWHHSLTGKKPGCSSIGWPSPILPSTFPSIKAERLQEGVFINSIMNAEQST